LNMSFDEALAYLLSLGHETLTIKLGLRNTQTLLAALGDPHREFPSVQIAGTNGKGSTAVTLDSICRTAGIRTGLFTSPHLISITERIQIAGEQVSEPDFASLTTQVKECAAELVAQGPLETLPTFFEHVTAIALLAFREARVELAILETGLGGRLDSTTAAGADIVAITPVSMDHEEYLGDSLAEIAAEKAAIIHPGVTAIVAPQIEEAMTVIMRQCQSAGVEPRLVDWPLTWSTPVPARYSEPFRTGPWDATRDGRCVVTFEADHEVYENITVGLRGRHQSANALTALALAEALRERGFAIKREAIIEGIATATHPGRLELWEGPPRILFDGAHNSASAKVLREYLDEFVKEPIIMIFGAMRDKAIREMAAAVLPRAEAVILTALDNPRAASVDILRAAILDSYDQGKVLQSSTVYEALQIAKRITPAKGLICITGSLYLVGASQKILNESSGVAHGGVGH
jgi:dihydrofolate synthase / folylpolyglutamate synthase